MKTIGRCGLLVMLLAFVACGSDSQRVSEGVTLPATVESLDSRSRELLQRRLTTVKRLLANAETRDDQLGHAYGDLAMLLHAYDLRDGARTNYRRAIEHSPKEFRWHYYLGDLARVEGSPVDSQRHLTKALEIRPDDVPTLVWLGVAASELDDLPTAEAYFLRAIDSNPNCARALFGLARIAQSREERDRALTYLQRALSQQPSAAVLRAAVVQASVESGDLQIANHLARVDRPGTNETIALEDPWSAEIRALRQDALAHVRRASAAEASGHWGLVVAELRQALATEPDRVAWRYGLVSALLRQGRLDEAEQELDPLLELAPDSSPVQSLLARTHLAKDDVAQAEASLQTALGHNPAAADLHFDLAELLRSQGRWTEALEKYSAASDLAPDLEQARFWAVVMESLDGQHLGAWTLLNRHLSALPSSPLLAMIGSRIHSAAPRAGLRDGARALELARAAFEREPTISAGETLAMALAELGRFSEAIVWQEWVVGANEPGAAGSQQALERLSLYRSGRPCRQPWAPTEELSTTYPRRDAPRLEEDGRSPGTQRMAERLAALGRSSPGNRYMNLQLLAGLRGRVAPFDPRQRAQFELDLAEESLRAGFPRAAAAHLERLLNDLSEDDKVILGGPIRSLLAVSFLRLGEKENCLLHHNPEACLLPISEKGRHHLDEGSRAAMREFGVILRDDPADLESRWLYNLAAMTLGEHPGRVPREWLISPEVFAPDSHLLRFPDVARRAGLATNALAGGAVVDDLDGDGYLDVMVSSWGISDPLRFFKNQRNSSFEDRTEAAGLRGLTGGLNLVHADYDNDGDNDVLVLRGAWLAAAGRYPNSLLRNRGNGVFDDVTEAVGLLDFHPTQTAAWADYDNDGWLDLFVGNESVPRDPHPCKLFRNNGPGEDGRVTFSEVGHEVGLDTGGDVKGAVWGDYDNDGWQDLYLSRLLEPNQLFRNQGASGLVAFREVATEAGVTKPENSFPTWFFDYDNDGWLDLFASSFPRDYLTARAQSVIQDALGLPFEAETARLYRNRRDGSFDDVTAATGLDRVLLAMGANFGDLDNDGWLDFYLGTGAPDFRVLIPNRMFRNEGGRVYRDVTYSGGFGHLQKGHAVAFADIDNDGDQDIFSVIGGAFSGDTYPNVLFANPGHGSHWLTLRLEGTASNRSAIGARIRLELETPTGNRQVFATVGTGGSFGSSSLQQEIGLGDALGILELEVSWPGSGRQTFTDIAVDQILDVKEGVSKPKRVTLSKYSLTHSKD